MKKFNLKKMLKGEEICTRQGNVAKFICKTGDKIFVRVYSKLGTVYNQDIKYNTDGSRWNASVVSHEDLMMVS